jgi:hypothetical protein
MGAQPITQEYFEDYAGRSLPYKKVWKDHSYFDECSKLFKKKKSPKIKSLCVLGTSSGQILREFHKRLGLKPYGCEISSWAYSQIPAAYKGRIQCEDMTRYISNVKKEGGHFDLVFTNSLMYLPERKIAPFLRKLSNVCSYLHFHGSFKESYCPDSCRFTLKSFSWWNKALCENGFEPFLDGRARTYCWKSLK